MQHDRWPHIDKRRLRELWDAHAPRFVKVEDVEASLPSLRVAFLAWLEDKGLLTPGPPGQLRRRIKLAEVSFALLRDQTVAEVSLALNGRSARAGSRGATGPAETLRLPAEATAEAVRELLPVVDLLIEDVYSTGDQRGRAPVAVVVGNSGDLRAPERYVGAAPIRGDLAEAAAKATLAAINRRAEIAASLYE